MPVTKSKHSLIDYNQTVLLFFFYSSFIDIEVEILQSIFIKVESITPIDVGSMKNSRVTRTKLF